MTRIGQSAVAAGAAAFLLALALGSWPAALVGAALVALAFGPRTPEATVTAERELPEAIEAGQPFEVSIKAKVPEGYLVWIEADAPPQARVLGTASRSGRTQAESSAQLIVDQPCALTFGKTRFVIQEPWGMQEDEIRDRIATFRYVRPEPAALDAGRILGKRARFSPRARRGFERETLVERLRDFEPGDRLRDIDWAHTAKLQKLIAKELQRSSTLPIVLLVDVSPPVRWRRLRSKVTTSVEACFGVLGAATARSHPIGLLAWSERGIEAQHRISVSRRGLPEMLRQLYRLPGEEQMVAPPAPADERERPLDPPEHKFLAASGSFLAGGSGPKTPLATALDTLPRVSAQPSLVIAILDVEERPALAASVARSLRRRGHSPIIAGLATGAHHYKVEEVDDDVLDKLLLWRKNRRAAEAHCVALGVPFILLAPRDGVEDLLGAIGFDA